MDKKLNRITKENSINTLKIPSFVIKTPVNRADVIFTIDASIVLNPITRPIFYKRSWTIAD